MKLITWARWRQRHLMSLISCVLALPVFGSNLVCAQSSTGLKSKEKIQERLGIVVFQFDDGSAGHYTYGFRILQKYNLKGSFGVVTGGLDKPGRLTTAQVTEMHKAGHEIHDHTLDHNAAFWGDPKNQNEWVKQIEESLGILRKMGIETRGWNQPGGKGQAWTEELRLTLSKYYDYAAGRVALRSEQARNIHWNLRDDPLSLGRGGISSWGYNRGKGEDAAKEVENIKTKIADGIQQGLVTIPLWHGLREEDRTAWGLEEICKFVQGNRLPTMVMADAVKAIRDPRDYLDKHIEQAPNPRFAYDLDNNGRPDGYLNCRYASQQVKEPPGEHIAEFENGTTTWIYGPEPGRTQFSFKARCADGASLTITPMLTFVEIDNKYEYHSRGEKQCGSASVGSQWKTFSFPVLVSETVDRVSIRFHVAPPGKVCFGNVSWRLGE